ncbi:MAG: SRPBCC family protein [Candidatus Alcyoniella australis]|nr:SRPBCC family protein [Candidatus Alcyoniella australis]
MTKLGDVVRKLRFFLGIALSLAMLGTLCVTAATAQNPADEGWVLKKDSDGLKIYNREKAGSDIKELLAIGTIDAAPARVFKVLGDYENFKDFMPYTEASHIIKTEQQGDKKLTWWFTLLDLPMVSDRYYTLVLTDGQEGDNFRSQWIMAKDMPPDPAWGDPSIAAYQGNRKEPVKTRENKGYWLLKPIDGGARTQANYYVYTDPGGSIPSWLANQANSIAIPELFKAVRERVQDPRYN